MGREEGAPVAAVEANRMTKRMNWQRTAHKGRPVMSIADDENLRGRDAAARWLARNDKPKAKKRRRSRRKGSA